MKQDLSKFAVWISFLIILLIAPHLFHSNFALTIISQIGIVIISCLSFNLLLGEGGMLSFGHAVYTGMGGYIAIHALNAWGKTEYFIPVTLLPLVGGVGSLVLATFLGFVSTRKSGTTFAMITLGTSELIASMALMFVDFFGGGWIVHQSSNWAFNFWNYLRISNPGLLLNCSLLLCLCCAHLLLYQDSAG